MTKTPDRSVEEMEKDWAKQDIWKALPFTKGFIERTTKTTDDAECILRKISEYHEEVVNIFTKTIQAERQKRDSKIRDLQDELRDVKASHKKLAEKGKHARKERDREIVEWAENNVAYKGDMGDGTDFKMISLYDLINYLTNHDPLP